MGSVQSDSAWQTLETTYRTYGLVLALGAGVSKAARIPDWITLLLQIESRCRGDSGTGLVRQLQQEGYSLPFIASALKAICPAGMAFTEIVRDALYEAFPFYGVKEIDRSNRDDFVAWIQAHNRTLSAVAAFCAVPNPNGQGRQYARNSRVHAVVNFNLDSILREYVQARYGQSHYGWFSILRTIERASKHPQLNKISLYHMHGNLRFDQERDPSKEGADKLVFNEEDYFDRFNSPTSLFNYTFLSLLREHSCLFIGLSMQDDNIRRLLHYSTREREQGYREEREPSPEERAVRHFAILRRHESEALNTVREKTLHRLGTRVLWIDGHDKTPEHLGATYAKGGEEWAKVYDSATPTAAGLPYAGSGGAAGADARGSVAMI